MRTRGRLFCAHLVSFVILFSAVIVHGATSIPAGTIAETTWSILLSGLVSELLRLRCFQGLVAESLPKVPM